MTASIEETLQSLPVRPGVYRMIGADEAVLYVGKAKNLKSRVSSYFVKSGHGARIQMKITQPPPIPGCQPRIPRYTAYRPPPKRAFIAQFFVPEKSCNP